MVSNASLGDRLYELMGQIHSTCAPDDLQVQDQMALVAVVGRKMTYRPGTSGKIFRALGDAGINIRTINQAADEISITVGVDNKDFEAAIRVLYEGFAG